MILAVAVVAATGIAGRVLIDPAKPVCTMSEPCTAPDGGEVLAFWRSGRRIATARTGSDGRFHAALAPGTYRIKLPRRRGRFDRLEPASIHISSGRVVHVVFRLDVGIR